MRSYMRAAQTNKEIDQQQLREVGLDEIAVQRMYRLLAIAKYEERFVIPTAHQEKYVNVYKEQGSCGYSLPRGCSACHEVVMIMSEQDKSIYPIISPVAVS